MVALFGSDLATHDEDWCFILGHDRPALCKQVVITFGNPRPIRDLHQDSDVPKY